MLSTQSPNQSDLQDYVDKLISPTNQKSYAGFNLLLLSPIFTQSPQLSAEPSGCGGDLRFEGNYVSNSGGGGVIAARPLQPEERRCGGITNGIESQNGVNWEKLVRGRAELQQLLDANKTGKIGSEKALIDGLFDILR